MRNTTIGYRHIVRDTQRHAEAKRYVCEHLGKHGGRVTMPTRTVYVYTLNSILWLTIAYSILDGEMYDSKVYSIDGIKILRV